MTPPLAYALIFGLALLVALVTTPLARRLSQRWGIVAVPGGRRRHTGRVAVLGGLPLFAAFLAGAGLSWWLLPPAGDDARRLAGVLAGMAVIFLGGLIDDRWELSPRWLLLLQTLSASVAMGSIVFIEVFTNPLNGQEVWLPRVVALAFTLFWMLGMINTVNMLDGLDGLAAGVGTVAALLFAWHSYNLGQTAVAAFPLALAGALLGFLPYNFAPASIFLGSAGAYALGYGLATLSILAPAKIATSLLVLAVPIMDVAWQITDRLRRGQSPMRGDRGHLHFRLSDGGLPTQVIVLGYYAAAIAFGLVAIFATGRWKLYMFLGLALLIWALLMFLTRRQRRLAEK